MKAQFVTLRVVATKAGISVSTASRALRGHPGLPAETIARVRRVAAECGYQSNHLIGAVMRKMRGTHSKTGLGTLAYLTFERTSSEWRKYPTYRQFYSGAKQGAEEFGFKIDEIWVQPKIVTAARLTQILRARGITGAILGPTFGQPTVPEIDWTGFSVVKIGVPVPEKPFFCVGHNHARGMHLALTEILKAGFERPGLVLETHQSLKMGEAWLSAYVGWQQHRPVKSRVTPLVVDKLSEAPFRKWCKKHRPDIVVGLRLDIVGWIRAWGGRIPEDVGFAHLDRPFDSESIGGIDQHPFEVGKAAVELLINHMLGNERGVPSLARSLLIDGSWNPAQTAARPGR